MKVIACLIVLITSYSTSFADSVPSGFPASDCTLTGTGDVYQRDPATGNFNLNKAESYSLVALRFPIGPGKYLYQETKTFADKRAPQVTMFQQSKAIGPYNTSSPDNSVRSS